MRVLDLLYTLGALNDRDELTKLGRRMAELPVDPMLTKASEDYSYTDEIRTIVSMISWFATQEATRRPGLEELRSSWRRSLNVWGQWADTNYSQQFCYEQFSQYKSLCRARDIRDQLVGVSTPRSNDITPIQKALTAGYFYKVAQLQKSGDSYRTLKTNQTVYIHLSPSLFQHQPPVKSLLYYELVLTSNSYVWQTMEIELVWLLEVAPHYFKPANLEQLSKGDNKMHKTVGAAPLNVP
ncbi:DUF1605-domain-containing protein [Russula ochroleuca]|uniref:DUF1605-domain-containing protein n=1 Tax=Russula ochroleuca TaxID=152965 RepID=A0A9P5K0L1_9AGAM|nr:DUF1605-domain-containing protein [Russula ochroleuca]KAF8474425.1 DUF1605-domain-containing protein [Russula ochroleuca]